MGSKQEGSFDLYDERGYSSGGGGHDATITATHAGDGDGGHFDLMEKNQLARGLKSRHIQYNFLVSSQW